MSATFQIKTVISAVDKITSPLEKINSRIKQAFKPIRQLHNATVKLKQELGFPKIGRGWADFRNSVSGVGAEIKSLGASLGIMTGAAGAAISVLAWKTSAAGDKAAKTAQQIGISTQAWTELAHAGDMSGISAEKMRQHLSKLNKALFDAAGGNKKAAYFLKQAGVSLYDESGRLRSADQALGDIANKFADPAFSNSAKRAALAMGLFGETGVELIPLLNSGKEGIDEMRREADRLGITFSELEGKQAEEFGDAISRVKKSIDGVVFTIGKKIIPAMTPLANKLTEIITKNRDLVGEKVREWIDKIIEKLPEIEKYLSKLWERTTAFATSVDNVVQSLGGWSNILPYLIGALAAIKLTPLIVSIGLLAKAFIGLGVAILTTPIGWIMGAIALLAGGAYLVYKKWDVIGPWFEDAWDAIKWTFSEAWAWLKEKAVSAWDGIVAAITDAFSAVTGYFDEIFGEIKAAFDIGFIDGLLAIFDKFNPLLFFTRAFDAVLKYLTDFSLLDAGEKIINSLWDGLKGMWSKVTDWLRQSIDELTDWMPDWAKKGLGIKVDIPKGIGTPFPSNGAIGGTYPAQNPLASQALQMVQQRVEQQRQLQLGQVDVNFYNMPRNAHVQYGSNTAGTIERRPYEEMLTGPTGLGIR